MTIQVNIAKATLSDVVDQVQAGEEVILLRDGEPVATVRTTKSKSSATQPRTLGIWDDLGLDIPDSVFLEPDPELEDLMDKPIGPKE
ncbi:type II toxin-antitoxin system Phd/YefM family antitoxin [Caulobacter mirabilis]|uniref:Uncharacterized protein n=1 Tax=Caulobacter mirabilis TaxID=69666 RepID=A0A2D2B248_9CAUL|nr:type II toxin-antitoxin system Phd/YefM family antitoxin [Caulobacter mirabilis]ATQ44314.1 hypothetical protein CSW64_18935 [Caulobacter mirabilis]